MSVQRHDRRRQLLLSSRLSDCPTVKKYHLHCEACSIEVFLTNPKVSKFWLHCSNFGLTCLSNMLPDWALPKVDDHTSIPLPVNRTRKVVRMTPTLTGLQRFHKNFFDLSPEIRNMIYKFIYVHPQNFGFDTSHRYHGQFPHHELWEFLGFSDAFDCQLIKEEASFIYFSENTFEFYRLQPIISLIRNSKVVMNGYRALAWEIQIPITSIKLNFHGGDPLRTFKFIKNHLPSLKKLEIWLEHFVYYWKDNYACFSYQLENAWQFFYTDYHEIRFSDVVNLGTKNPTRPIPQKVSKNIYYRLLVGGLKEYKLAQTPKKKRAALLEAVRLSIISICLSSVFLTSFSVEVSQRSSGAC